MLSIIKNAESHINNRAIIGGGKEYSFKELLLASEKIASVLLNNIDDLSESRVAFMVNPGFDYVKVQWGIWRAGGVSVPLCLTHPLPSLEYVLEDTEATILIVSDEYEAFIQPLVNQFKLRFIVLGKEPAVETKSLPDIDISRRAMILFTSGTTNKPKGVVTTHSNLEAQISTLVSSWEWTEKDHTLCVLPLHHVHGIVNVVSCALWAGATCEFIDAFSAEEIFNLFLKGKLNVFMAVPTIYYKLISHWEGLNSSKQHELTQCMSSFRLMVCGSAALPVSVMEKWKGISGHTLLERYGMTEIGMAVSNPYHGERKAGYIGMPLPGVQIKLVNENYEQVASGEPGEILVKGKNVFKEYWNKPEATASEFTADGWFKTGDVAVEEDGYIRIMGRNSVDIIKSGGYKISALEIEEELRKYEAIADCAVVGIPNDEWGELIVSAIVVNNKEVDLNKLNAWMRERMATYKTPRKYLIVNELPRNAMGKVTKNDVKKLF